MDKFRLPEAIENSQRILIAGAGGGFDVYAGLPIYHRLRHEGKQVYRANLSFTYLEGTGANRLSDSLFVVDGATTGEAAYFPERTLARFVPRAMGEPVQVYAFPGLGVRPIRKAYRSLAAQLNVDAIVLVDGGTDILLRGDEPSLGTPAEDMVSLAAVNAVDVPTRMVVCSGFGVDAYHGVCHANWLENLAGLVSIGAFRGVIALLQDMPEVQFYLAAVADAEITTPDRPSVVNGSIASAIEGRFGNYHRYNRTRDTRLFINPLMSLLWMCDLAVVARRNLYLDRLAETESNRAVLLEIEAFQASVQSRARESIPH